MAQVTLVGQNLGAGQPDRAEISAWRAAKYNVIFMTVAAVIMFVFAQTITGWFTLDPEVLRLGTNCLRIIAIGFPFYANGVFIAEVVAESLLTIMSIIVFRRGGWKVHEA